MAESTADGRIRTTEWEDVQYKHGNKVGNYRDKEIDIVAQKIADQLPDGFDAYDPAMEKIVVKLERHGISQRQLESAAPAEAMLETMETVLDEECGSDDEDAIARFRTQRRQEAEKLASVPHFSAVIHISCREDYVSHVSDASKKVNVVCVMIKPGNSDCDSLVSVLHTLAATHPKVKFCTILSVDAIPNFPDKHLPCVLVYRGGQMTKQLTGLEPWGGKKMNVSSVEATLAQLSVFAPPPPLEEAAPAQRKGASSAGSSDSGQSAEDY
jgi:hypothetical protein